jgi:hypothetical protein
MVVASIACLSEVKLIGRTRSVTGKAHSPFSIFNSPGLAERTDLRAQLFAEDGEMEKGE